MGIADELVRLYAPLFYFCLFTEYYTIMFSLSDFQSYHFSLLFSTIIFLFVNSPPPWFACVALSIYFEPFTQYYLWIKYSPSIYKVCSILPSCIFGPANVCCTPCSLFEICFFAIFWLILIRKGRNWGKSIQQIQKYHSQKLVYNPVKITKNVFLLSFFLSF